METGRAFIKLRYSLILCENISSQFIDGRGVANHVECNGRTVYRHGAKLEFVIGLSERGLQYRSYQSVKCVRLCMATYIEKPCENGES